MPPGANHLPGSVCIVKSSPNGGTDNRRANDLHQIGSSHKERVAMAGDLLEEVGLPREYLRRYPHEFSGGQRQRICIARTLALKPRLIICDESVSALDVSVQAQVLNLLKNLQIKYDLTYVFISHDLSVVKFMSDVMAVMRGGKIVEMGPSESIYRNPKEQYTRDLIASIPKDDLETSQDCARVVSTRENSADLKPFRL